MATELQDQHIGDIEIINSNYVTSAVFRCQSWTAGDTYDLYSVKLYCKRVGTCGTLTVEIYAHSGDLPTDGVLATNTVDCSAWSTSIVEHEIIFDAPYTVTSGTKYVIAIKTNGANSSNCISVGGTRDTDEYADGRQGYYLGGWALSVDTADILFKTYSEITVDYVDVAGTIVGVSALSGILTVDTLTLISGTIAGTSSLSGTLILSVDWSTDSVIATRRLIAIGNNQLWYEDI